MGGKLNPLGQSASKETRVESEKIAQKQKQRRTASHHVQWSHLSEKVEICKGGKRSSDAQTKILLPPQFKALGPFTKKESKTRSEG